MASEVLTVNSYTVLQVKLHPEAANPLNIFIKRADSSLTQGPVERTIEVRGIPAYVTRVAVKRLFAKLVSEREARVRVRLESDLEIGAKDKPKSLQRSFFDKRFTGDDDSALATSNRAAYVTFRSADVTEKVLRSPMCSDQAVLYASEAQALSESRKSELPIGLAAQFDCFSRRFTVHSGTLQQEIDDFMREFDATHRGGKRSRNWNSNLQGDGEEDEEAGWQTVQTKRATKRSDHAQSGIMRKLAAKQKREHQAADFYRFQLRDSRVKQIEEVKERFETDKKRVAEMKAARRFRPL